MMKASIVGILHCPCSIEIFVSSKYIVYITVMRTKFKAKNMTNTRSQGKK